MKRADLRRRIERVRRLMQEEARPFEDSTKSASEARKKRALADPFYFMKTYLPHYFREEFAEFHREMVELVETPDVPVLIAAPRGHAKSTIISFALPLRAILFNLRHFIVFLSDTRELAASFITFIKLELEENERIKQDFGSLRGYPWSEEDFTTKNGVRVKARGTKDNFRGIRNRQWRPDWVIVDDYENDDTVRSKKTTEFKLKKLKEAVIPALEPGYWFTYVGTLLSKKCVLARMIQEAEEKGVYIARVWKAIQDGKPLWPERFSLSELERRRKIMGAISFAKEYLNQPQEEEAPFREEWIRWVSKEELPSPLRYVAYLDPSMKSGEENDYKALVVLGVAKDGTYYARYAWLKRTNPGQMAKAVYDAYEKFRCLVVGAEENALGEFLYTPFDEEARRRGYVLPLKGIHHTANKRARIERLSPLVERGKLRFVKNDSGDMRLLVEQLTAFPEGDHDDGPDALEGAVSIAERFAKPVELRRAMPRRFKRGGW